MVKVVVLLVCLLVVVNFASSTRFWTVDPCDACNAIGKWYVGGCSGLTAALLGKPQKWTGNYQQGAVATSSTLDKGDILGWRPLQGQRYGHVTVYVGYGCCNCKYVEAQLNVARNGGTAVCRHNDYGRTLYHMGY